MRELIKTNKILLIACMLIFSAICHAQETPNAASLGIFGQIPVGHFTGTPNINIPLYSLQTGNFNVPVELSYHTSMVKPEHHPGWVGLGWNLFAGGAITRVVKDAQDEKDSYYSYEKNYNELSITDWTNPAMSTVVYWNAWGIDLEPDEFTFNFGNYSGSFFMDHTGAWQVRSSQPVSMQITSVAQGDISISSINTGITVPKMRAYYKFTIKTDDGTEYIFGGAGNAIESSHDNSCNNGCSGSATELKPGIINTWYLTKITTPDNHVIDFEYKRGPLIISQTKYLYAEFKSKKVGKCSGLLRSCFTEHIGSHGPRTYICAQTPLYLQYIKSANCTIEFFSSESSQLSYPNANMYVSFTPKWLKLDSIQVKNKNTDLVKRIKFIYNNSSSARLKLSSVAENGSLIHSFTYNTTALPAYNSMQTDHWGYYNGRSYHPAGNTAQNSLLSIETTRSYQNADTTYFKAEILEKITYPTGGQAIFVYEPHECNRYVLIPSYSLSYQSKNNGRVGGLRIKKIRLLNHDQKLVKETDYLYIKDYADGWTKSSGILAGQPKYYDEFNLLGSNNYVITFSDRNPGPLSYTNGSHITYSEVVEKVTGGGYTVYGFTNFDTSSTFLDKPSYYSHRSETYNNYPFSSKDFLRGKPLFQKYYTENNLLIKEIVNKYSVISEEEYVRSIPIAQIYEYYEPLYFPYKIYTGKQNLLETTTTINDENGLNPIVTTEKYNYNRHNLLSNVITSRSDGKTQTTSFVYPFDIKEGADLSTMQKMTGKNILSNYVEKVTYLDDGKVIDGEYRKYNEVQTNIFKPERIDILRPKSSLQYETLYPWKNTYTTCLDVESSNSKLFYFSLSQSEQLKITLSAANSGWIWIDNLNYWSVAYAYSKSFSSTCTEYITLPAGQYEVDFLGKSIHCNIAIRDRQTTMQGNTNLSPEIYYQYDSKGNLRESKPAGSNVSTTYLWGYNYQYPIAKIENATYESVRNTLGGQTVVDRIANANKPDADFTIINNLRTQLPNAMVTTYTYKPLVGILTVTNPLGTTITYNYDSFGRLKTIKDVNDKKVEEYEYHYKN